MASIPRAGPPEGTGDAEALALPCHDVRSLAAGVLEYPVGQRLREGRDQQGAPRVGPLPRPAEVFDAAEEVRRLEGHGGQPVRLFQAAHIGQSRGEKGNFLDLITGRGEVGPDHLPVMGMDRPGKGHPLFFGDADRHEERLGKGRGAVVMGSRHHVHPQEAGRQRLVLVDSLQRALEHLRLVRGVGRHKLGTAEEGPDRRGNVMVVTSRPHVEPVLRGNGHHPCQAVHVIIELPFAQGGGKPQLSPEPAVGRDGRKEVIDLPRADHAEHGGDVLLGVGKVAHSDAPL